MIFETHAHYDHRRFNKNREELLKQVLDSGVDYIINPAIPFESNFTMREKLGSFEQIWFATGIHPAYIPVDEMQDDMRLMHLRKFTKDSRTVAIGETGLDYYHSTVGKERQELWFRRQIELAQEVKLPLILHVRDADEDALNILNDYHFHEFAGILHCFHGNRILAEEYINRGFLLGIGGTLTYPDMDEFCQAVREVPLEKMVLETDAPFLTPDGWDEKPNSSLSLTYIAEQIALLKGITQEEVIESTYKTAKLLFRI